MLFTRPNAAASRPQNFTADRALLRAAINEPFAPALTDPHPDRSGRLIAAAAAVLLAIGVAATWVPVRRATRIDPGVVLRES